MLNNTESNLIYKQQNNFQLTPRENLILSHAKRCLPVAAIAAGLNVSETVISRHLKNIIRKLSHLDNDLAMKISKACSASDENGKIGIQNKPLSQV